MSGNDGFWERRAAPWLKHEAVMERLLAPAGAALDAVLALKPGEAVLDIGPGSGSSLMRHLAAVGPGGRVVGVDIAPPFAERARARTRCEVVVADAGAGPVEEGAFDAVASQFGAMFFDDPAAAFAVVGRNLAPGGRFACVAWGPRGQNPLFSLPGQVAADLLGAAPPEDPDAPGPFGLQNASRTVALLGAAGFDEARAEAVGLTLASGLDARSFAAVQAELGPAAARLREAEAGEEAAREMVERLGLAFTDHETGGEVALPAVVHVYSARWPG